jgi:hypothetical protein
MMIDSTSLYFLIKLDAIHEFLAAVTILSGLSLFGILVSMPIIFDKYGPINVYKYPKLFKRLFICNIITAVLSGLLLTFTPTTKEAAIIWGVPKVLNSEFVQEELPKETKELYGLAKMWLKQKIEEDQ